MSLLISTEDYHEYLLDCVEKSPKRILISTFGIYAGIPENQHSDIPATRAILNKISEKDIKTTIVIGYSKYLSCKGRSIKCYSCEIKYIKSMMRLSLHAMSYPNIKWKMTDNLHLKSNIFLYDKSIICVTGGRNFTGSDWQDLSIIVEQPDDKKKMVEHFTQTSNASCVIDEQAILEVLKQQEISDKALKLVMDGI